MTYPYYQSNPNASGWGNNQFQYGRPPTVQFQPQPSWGGSDFFRAHAPDTDPELFSQVYNNISGAGAGIHSFGVSIGEARLWHHRAYGGLGATNALTPQEIGYASAYEAYRIWIHNIELQAPLGGEIERQREALIGLAVAEASRMYMSSRPADVYGRVPACEAAAATAMLAFDQNLTGGAREDMGNAGMGYGVGTGSGARMGYNARMGYDARIGYGAGMGVGAYGSGFGPPGMAGSGMSGGMDPYAIDYEAPYFRQRTGRHRRLSMPSPGGGGGMPMGGMEGSPYLGAGGIGANPAMYGRRDFISGGMSPMPGIYGRRSPMPGDHGGVPSTGSLPPANGGVSQTNRSPMIPASSATLSPANGGGSQTNRSPIIPTSSANFTQYPAADVTTVPAYPGTTTVIRLPRRHKRHHRHHSRRAQSAEPATDTGATHSPAVGGAFGGAAKVVGGAVGGITGGAAGLVGGAVGGAVGGLARGAVGGLRGGATVAGGPGRGAMGADPVGTNDSMEAGVGGYYPGGLNPNVGPSYPGYRGIYRY